MKLTVPREVMDEVHSHAEKVYPEEAAGLILGSINEDQRVARRALPMPNYFETDKRGHRYRLDPREILQAEELADQLGMDVIGVFHSHPDHPPDPSAYDLEWAVPWYVYVITSVRNGKAAESRAWKLEEDHEKMIEETLQIKDGEL